MDKSISHLLAAAKDNQPMALGELPAGYDAMLLATLAPRAYADLNQAHLHIAQDDARLYTLKDAISFFNPELDIILFPAWDCQPYDRVGPNNDIVSQRIDALTRLLSKPKRSRLILTTANALLQRVLARDILRDMSLSLARGDENPMGNILTFLSNSGYRRSDQVTEAGDFAIRGGLLDLFPIGGETPYRLDYFGDEIDSIRTFDPIDQRTTGHADKIHLKPASELDYSEAGIQRFRRNYVNTFGPAKGEDPLYEAISDGRRYQGAEHWAGFFHDRMESLMDYVTPALVTADAQIEEAASGRLESIADYYDSRREAMVIAAKEVGRSPYKPAPADSLYLSPAEWSAMWTTHARYMLAAQPILEGQAGLDFGGRTGPKFVEARAAGRNVYDAVVETAQAAREAGKRVVFASYSAGSASRMADVLGDHDLSPVAIADDWAHIRTSPKKLISVATVQLESGFETSDLLVITEQDILGDKLTRRANKSRKADNFLRDASSLHEGDLVVHTSHGIGRFMGLKSLDVTGAPHDCLQLEYHGGDKLFVPVENIEVLSRFGNEDSGQVDKLGGVAWQARKARMKERIREMADALIKIAAQRAMREGHKVEITDNSYAEFCARFPYQETEDQLRAIEDVTKDLASGKPMDRLVCGDVGFGKTEVALRAAFLAAMAGLQVAIIAPTTLLARQHTEQFQQRFKGFPLRIGQLSRLVSSKNANLTKGELADGTLDIVIGTHALLGKTINFKRLGLVIVDEEQHFGVAHKERLKELRADVHVLTMTATPIPRTLQMAMTGIRDLSIIASPPVDRLAIRTFVLPFDPMLLREALLREHYRGGQSFFVVPRIADLEAAAKFLDDHVPEIKYIIGHGQMPARTLEDVMTAFYEGQYDVLLATTIVESGIDIPRANTLVVYRADMFGLAQLYQIRGRVGRSKTRAYAYLTTPEGKLVKENAAKRLEVLQSLDTLGAGFTLASHDMDIRGAGNLLGDEQSGHIKEVGVELYQQMLEDAVAAAKAGTKTDDGAYIELDWSPQLNLGATVMIPERYVPDLSQRMALYRRLADLNSREDVDAYCAELIDRFGPLPSEVKQLAATMIIKAHAKRAGIERLDAGPRGMTIMFREQKFANPAGLVEFISGTGNAAKIRPDHALVYQAKMDKLSVRLKSVAFVAKKLAGIAEASS